MQIKSLRRVILLGLVGYSHGVASVFLIILVSRVCAPKRFGKKILKTSGSYAEKEEEEGKEKEKKTTTRTKRKHTKKMKLNSAGVNRRSYFPSYNKMVTSDYIYVI